MMSVEVDNTRDTYFYRTKNIQLALRSTNLSMRCVNWRAEVLSCFY